MIYINDLLTEINNVKIKEFTDEDYFNNKPDPAWEYIQSIIDRVPNIYKDDLEWLDVEIATDGDILLFKYETDCETIADALDDHVFGSHECHTGYYDPEEDRRNDEIDEHTGWYYIDWSW